MHKKEFILLASFVFLIVLFVLFFLSLFNNNEEKTSIPVDLGKEIIIFSGDTCPDCHIVEAYIVKNQIDKKLNINIKEVYNDISNAYLYEDKFRRCNPQPEIEVVPMLWEDGFCLTGPDQIIPYLNSKLD